jgi:SAM-dependent methyltransferase
MIPALRQWLFETLYRNRTLYRFASTIPFAGQWRVWQRLVLPRIHGLDVLELGCGLGDLLADMLQAGYRCRAIEHSSEMVSATRATLHKRRVGEASCVIEGAAQSLPFSNHSFDTVISTFPSEYIYDPDTIAEVARVLRPGGRLIVIEGANLLPIGFIQPLLILLQMLVYGPAALFGPHKDPTEVFFGHHILLERFGLRRRSERVRSRHWEVYITLGEKEHDMVV